MCYILKIVDDTGFENLVEPVNVSSEPSDHSPSHNEGKNAYYYAVTIFLTLTQAAMVYCIPVYFGGEIIIFAKMLQNSFHKEIFL